MKEKHFEHTKAENLQKLADRLLGVKERQARWRRFLSEDEAEEKKIQDAMEVLISGGISG